MSYHESIDPNDCLSSVFPFDDASREDIAALNYAEREPTEAQLEALEVSKSVPDPLAV